jgi:hypothetical protein
MAIALGDLVQEALMLDSNNPSAIALQIISRTPACLWAYCQDDNASFVDALARLEGFSVCHHY